ncbi:MAG: helix-turn-helix transcriptional regulator [Sulfurimonas sp.]
MKINKFKVKELMAQKKINSQIELAEMLGISKNQLSNILSEKFNPIKSNVVELADFFGVSPLEIIENKKVEEDGKTDI